MTRAERQACVNIKYNHVDSKTTFLVSLSICHEYTLNESWISSFEIQVNLCEPMTSVSSSKSIKLSLIYLGPLLKVLKCCIYIYNAIFTKYLIFYYYNCREYIYNDRLAHVRAPRGVSTATHGQCCASDPTGQRLTLQIFWERHVACKDCR